MKKEEARRQLTEHLNHEEDELELDRLALLIAAEEYPALEVEDYLARLDRYASAVSSRFEDADDLVDRVLKLRDFLFVEVGLSGNQEDYFDARNSYLNEVLERRKGIPITLSLVFMEVARRIGLPILGVGMPGHFIVKFIEGGRALLLDPFHEGRELTENDCREMISEMYGEALAFHPAFLHAVNKRQIVTRILQNLKGIYLRYSDKRKLLGVAERLVLLNPTEAMEIRDRGLAYLSLGKLNKALADLEEYLRRVPEASDRKEIRKRIGELRQQQAQLN